MNGERRAKILEYLDDNEQVTYRELSAYLKASEATVRRDLCELEKRNEILRYWGGARRSPDRTSRQDPVKRDVLLKEKRIIGEIAASMIGANELIFIGSGTTTLTMIPYIPVTSITVITNGIPQLEALNSKNIQAFLLCGFLKKHSRAVVGRQTVEMLSAYRFDKAFFGANGFDDQLSLLSADEYEHDIKKIGIQNSSESYVLVDHTKFGCYAMYRSSMQELGRISIITDQRLENHLKYEEYMRGYIYRSENLKGETIRNNQKNVHNSQKLKNN